MGRFDDITASPSQTGRFDNIGTVKGRFDDLKVGEPEKGILSKVGSKIGGAFGTLGKILSTGQRAVTGAAEFGLEKTGILKDTGASPLKSIKNEASNIDLLKRVGEERGGGVLTGQYKPTQSVFGNFVKELPVTTIGTLADVFADPLFVVGKLGKVAEATGKAGQALKAGYTNLSKEIPAVQKVGDMLGRAFVTRYGQGEAFKNLDIGRKIEESLAQEKVGKLVADVIEKPQFIQKRIAQVIKGGISSDDELKVLAQPIREELDRVGKAISDINPKLLSEETFLANKGTYFPRLYTSKEIDTTEEIVSKAFGSRAVSTPKDAFQHRLRDFEFAKSIDPKLVDTENEIRKIYNKVDSMVDTRSNYISKLETEIKNLNKKGIHISLKPKKATELPSLTSKIKVKTVPTTEQVRFGENDVLLDLITKPGYTQATDAGLVSTTNKQTRQFIDSLIKAPNEEVLKIKRLIGTRDKNIDSILDDIVAIRKESNEAVKKLPSLQSIKQLAEQARKNMGEITEAGFPALKRLTQLNIVEKRQEFFSEVAKLASKEAQPGFIQLSSDKSLGDLAGKFLPVAEYNAIAQMRRVPTQLEEIYGKGLSLWKTFKTAYNPSTITRNDLTNYFILNPLGGVGPHRLDIYARWANEMKTKGPLYQMARKEGLEISTQQAAELTQQATRFYRANEGVTKQFFNKVGDFHEAVKNFYGSQDKFFKGANFLKGVTEDGLTPTQAMRRANFYLIDYSEVPEFIQWLRKSPIGIPFISFTYGVSKPLARTLLERPDKLSAYYKILNGIQSMNPLGETPQELQREEDVLPDWISSGTYLRLPVKDKIGRSQYVDLQYILPTNVLEASNLVPSSPVFSWTAALMTNKDPYFQKEIWSENDKPEEKAKKGATYLLKQFFPSLTPFIGSSYQKISNAIQKRPDRSGFVKGNIQMIIDVLGGIRVTPIDPTIEGQKRASEKQKEVRDLQTQLRLIMLDKSLFPEEKERQAGEVREELQTVFSE